MPIDNRIWVPDDPDDSPSQPSRDSSIYARHVQRVNHRMREDYPEIELWTVKVNHTKRRMTPTPPGTATAAENTFDLRDGSGRVMLYVPAPFDVAAWKYLFEGATVVVRYRKVSRQEPYIASLAGMHRNFRLTDNYWRNLSKSHSRQSDATGNSYDLSSGNLSAVDFATGIAGNYQFRIGADAVFWVSNDTDFTLSKATLAAPGTVTSATIEAGNSRDLVHLSIVPDSSDVEFVYVIDSEGYLSKYSAGLTQAWSVSLNTTIDLVDHFPIGPVWPGSAGRIWTILRAGPAAVAANALAEIDSTNGEMIEVHQVAETPVPAFPDSALYSEGWTESGLFDQGLLLTSMMGDGVPVVLEDLDLVIFPGYAGDKNQVVAFNYKTKQVVWCKTGWDDYPTRYRFYAPIAGVGRNVLLAWETVEAGSVTRVTQVADPCNAFDDMDPTLPDPSFLEDVEESILVATDDRYGLMLVEALSGRVLKEVELDYGSIDHEFAYITGFQKNESATCFTHGSCTNGDPQAEDPVLQTDGCADTERAYSTGGLTLGGNLGFVALIKSVYGYTYTGSGFTEAFGSLSCTTSSANCDCHDAVCGHYLGGSSVVWTSRSTPFAAYYSVSATSTCYRAKPAPFRFTCGESAGNPDATYWDSGPAVNEENGRIFFPAQRDLSLILGAWPTDPVIACFNTDTLEEVWQTDPVVRPTVADSFLYQNGPVDAGLCLVPGRVLWPIWKREDAYPDPIEFLRVLDQTTGELLDSFETGDSRLPSGVGQLAGLGIFAHDSYFCKTEQADLDSIAEIARVRLA